MSTHARAVFRRHPWATRLMESRKEPGPAAMRYYDAVLGCLRRDGFTPAEAASAFSLIDSYLYGFALQEQSLPFKTRAELGEVADALLAQLPRDDYPYLSEMVEHALTADYTYAAEFERALDLVLDGLEKLRDRSGGRVGR